MKIPVRRYKDEENSLKIETFYHITAEPGKAPWSFPLHSHKDLLEISLITAGKAEFECDHVRYTLATGDLVVKNAGVIHSEISVPEDGFEQYCLGISGVHAPDMPADTLVPDGISPVIKTGSAYDYLRSMTAYLYEISSDPSIQSSDLTRQAIENELSLINLLIQNSVEVSSDNSYSELISNVLDHIDSHPYEAMSLEILAKQFYVSSFTLAHRFKAEVGCTVNQYILNRKLGEAQERLVFSGDPIKEIAADCGYSSLQYFYSVFKKYTGSTPAEVRHRYEQLLAGSI